MFSYGGKNHFGDRFDFFEWSAPFYEDSKEVYKAIQSLKIEGKTLKAINSIGTSQYVNWPYLYDTITDAGIELGDLWWEKYEHISKVLVPWSIHLCEPLQFVFDDNTTLEILPTERGGARIGVNSIPVGLVNGLNQSNLDSNKLFQEFCGAKLRRIELSIQKKETHFINDYSINAEDPYVERRTKYIIRFTFEYPYELELIQTWGGGYTVCARGEPNQKKINFGRFESSQIPTEQVEIESGRGDGGTFWIIGANENKEMKPSIPDLDCFGMSIDDTYVGEFLSVFLYRYYDPSIQQRDEYEGPDFDWYGINLYSFENIRKMLLDIYRTIDLIKTNYDDPELAKFKSKWSIYEYMDYSERTIKDMTAEEINCLRRKRIPKAIDFYERFCLRMEHMLKIPGINLISFAGP